MQVILDLVKGLATFLANTIKTHWSKMLFALSCALVFFVLLFPYSDLTSFASKFIFEQTKVSVRIESMGLKIIPLPGVKASGVSVNISNPPLNISNASLTPNLFSTLLNSGVFFSSSLEGVLDGDIDFSLSAGDAIPDKDHIQQDVDINAEGIQVSQLIQLLKNNTMSPVNIPMEMKGKISLITDASVDPQFGEQPNVEFEMNGQNLKFPAQSFPTPMGPLNFPELTWSTIYIKGRLVGGELIIEDATLGKLGDPFFIRSKGKLSLRFRNTPRGVVTQLGTYEVSNDWVMTQSVQDSVGILLSPIAGDYKSQTSSGTRYLFRATGQNTGGLPRTQGIRSL